MDHQQVTKTRFQRFCDKSTHYLIGLFVIWTVVRLIDYFFYLYCGNVISADDHSSFQFHITSIFNLLLTILYFLVPAFSIFYVIVCFWKEVGLERKLLRAAVLPICYIAMTVILFATHAVIDMQKDNLDEEQTIGSITYSVPNHWRLFEDYEMEKGYTDPLTAAWIDVSIEEAESLEVAANLESARLKQDDYIEHREVSDITLDAPYFCYIYKTDQPERFVFVEFLIMQYAGKLYEFNMEADEEDDLSVFKKMCESIQLE